jgi:hypothetical protein
MGILFAFFFSFVLSICFFVFGDLGFFVFQLFLQLLVLGIVQCVISADPISSSEAKGGFPSMPAAH